MKNTVACLLIVLFRLVSPVVAQSTSSFNVRYLVTYDATASLFTAWVVPDYDTPNSNNPDTDERGITAQFALKVPGSFVLTQLQDVRGHWEKKPVKIDPRRHFANRLSDGHAYYVIGKAPAEDSYGEFKRGEPVALFTFRGESADPAQVQPLEAVDPFIGIAENEMSLNVKSSFYSRSGQGFKPHLRPLEQFLRTTTLSTVLRDARQRETATAQFPTEEPTGTMLLYPNPVQQVLTVKYFSDADQVPAVVEWIDLKGVTQQTKQAVAKQGLNTMQLSVVTSPGSTYFVRMTVNGKSSTGKVLKL